MNANVNSFGRTEAAICQKQIDALVEQHAEIGGALVSTGDGFDVAARIKEPLSAAKLSAMASSMMALAEAVSAESAIGECNDMIIDASGGRVFFMGIPNTNRSLLLTVLCDNEMSMGQVLWAARNCRAEIASRLATD